MPPQNSTTPHELPGFADALANGIAPVIPDPTPRQQALFALDTPQLQADKVRCRKCLTWQPWNGGKGWDSRWNPLCPACLADSFARYYADPDKRQRRQKQVRDSLARLRADPNKRQRMQKHNRKSWARAYADPDKRQRIREQKRKNNARRYADPNKRQRILEQGRESNARRYADPDKRQRKLKQARESNARAYADPVKRQHRLEQKNIRHAHKRGLLCHCRPNCFGLALRGQPQICAEPDCHETETLHRDHIMPLDLNGPHCGLNAQYLCQHHNDSKKNRHPADWAAAQGRPLTPSERRSIAATARFHDLDTR